ncbi:flagellar basal body P-ring formation protein FlgA [Sneathiella sp. P13V-1]|uniref:flagellar basal body P-ring formation chaperone FlgA n=1 Tax=Sneathiella sp. P13V-1 TaxID=2697366 RepID=UPI00187B50CE|nr:flagellar basal body P-ring formation chaperone FlgA [Sneathiella sp. P13V-1]MBE7638304.1 flagellar basal body P-ring formation protein FlgA [Sneathiella sp. P13V-1]
MKHIGIFILFISCLMGAMTASAANTVTLKSKPVVEGENITFGDIFTGVGEKSDYVIAASPAPGKTVSFKASSVAFVAQKHGLDWQPTRSVSMISVLRKGQIIPQERVEEHIRAALEMELATDQFELDMPSRFTKIQISVLDEPEIVVESLSYNERKNSFSAIISAPANSDNATNYRVVGKFYPQAMVPVSTRLIRTGEKIREQDVEFQLVRKNRVGRNIVLDVDELVGKSPRRSMRAGGTFHLNNLGDPVTIAKGKIISVIFKRGGIALTMTGRALENGSEGDIIRVENAHSRKVIQAEVIDDQQVRIITAQQRLATIQ